MTDTSLTEASELNSEISDSADSEQEQFPSPGRELKKLREKLGYSHEKVSEALYMTKGYVSALEDDNYTNLPGHTFIKGYYKAYAKFLGADTEKILNIYLKCLENDRSTSVQDVPIKEPENHNKIILWIAIVVAMIAVLAVVYL